jgi:hypothetical protein
VYGIQLLATEQWMLMDIDRESYRWVSEPTYPFAAENEAKEVVRNQVGGGAYGKDALTIAKMPDM